MNEHQRLAIQALDAMRSPKAERIRWATRSLTPEQMDEKRPDYPLSPRQILEHYEEPDHKIDAAIAWIEAQGRSTEPR